jgi:hypothetical protein
VDIGHRWPPRVAGQDRGRPGASLVLGTYVLKVTDFRRLEQPSASALQRFPVVTRVPLGYRASAPLSPSEHGTPQHIADDFLLDRSQAGVAGAQARGHGDRPRPGASGPSAVCSLQPARAPAVRSESAPETVHARNGRIHSALLTRKD